MIAPLFSFTIPAGLWQSARQAQKKRENAMAEISGEMIKLEF